MPVNPQVDALAAILARVNKRQKQARRKPKT